MRCKKCHKEIIYHDEYGPRGSRYTDTSHDMWFICDPGAYRTEYHEPEEKEDLFTKLYERLK